MMYVCPTTRNKECGFLACLKIINATEQNINQRKQYTRTKLLFKQSHIFNKAYISNAPANSGKRFVIGILL